MLGEKIKALRASNSLTQKDLAEKLYVTAQAVSRWENNEVEPSLTTLTEMAKIFNTSISELLGETTQQEVKPQAKQEAVPSAPSDTNNPVLAVCELCNKPIYKSHDIVRKTEHFGPTTVKKVFCTACDKQQKDDEHKKKVFLGLEQRQKSFIWGGILSGLITLFLIMFAIFVEQDAGLVIINAFCGVLFFPFLSCLYLKNNFIGTVVEEVASWSIRFPGLIFTLDLDGIVWFITVKILFCAISFLFSIACIFLAVVLGCILSLFVYPFAILKNIQHPELTKT